MEGDLDTGLKWHKNGVTYLLKGDNYWRFDGEKSLIRKIFHKGNWDGLLENLLKDCPCDCDHCCNEKWKLQGIKYHIVSASVVYSPPEILGIQVVDNRDGSGIPSIEFTVSKSVTETEIFTNTVGASLTVGTVFNVGVPIISDGKISTSLTRSYVHSSGKEKSVRKTISATYTCPGVPGKRKTCKSTLSMSRMDVPYTMILRHEDKGCTCESKGVFKKLAVSRMTLHVEEG